MQGRRGGQCRQLGVPVQGCWKSCALAVPPFASSWRNLEHLEHIVVESVVENIVGFHPPAPAFASSTVGLEISAEGAFQAIEVSQ
jgi:hypothetical protein